MCVCVLSFSNEMDLKVVETVETLTQDLFFFFSSENEHVIIHEFTCIHRLFIASRLIFQNCQRSSRQQGDSRS